MSNSKKRTVSELLKKRKKGRFASEGFDLLGEGEKYASSKRLSQALFEEEAPSPLLDSRSHAINTNDPLGSEGSDGSDFDISSLDSEKSDRSSCDGDGSDSAGSDVSEVDSSSEGGLGKVLVGVVRGVMESSLSVSEDSGSLLSASNKAQLVDGENPALSRIGPSTVDYSDPNVLRSVLGDGGNSDSSRSDRPISDGGESDISNSDRDMSDGSNVDTSISDSAESDSAESDMSDPGGAVSSGLSTGRSRSDRGGVDSAKGDALSGGVSKKVNSELKSSTRPSIATKEYHRVALEELEFLRSMKTLSVRVDTYVIDSLFSKIANPTASLVYLYLWRRTIGQGQERIKISAQIIAESLGLSRRTVQLALRKLNEMGYIATDGLGELGIPEHRVLSPWR